MEVDETQIRYYHRPKQTLSANQLIQQLNKRQRLLKNQIQRCDILFLKQKMTDHNKRLCEQEVIKEQQKFQSYLQIYRRLDKKNQKPYTNMVKRFKDKVKNHELCLQHAQQNKHRLIIDSKKQIWEEEFFQQPQSKFYLRGILGLLGTSLLYMIFGATFRGAMIGSYITSYYKITNDPYLEARHNSINVPITMLGVGLTMKNAIKLSKIFENKMQLGKVVFLLIIVLATGIQTLIASFMPSFLLFTLFHSFLFGACVGCLYLTSVTQCQKYFNQKRKLLVSSIVLTGSGAGCIFFGQLNVKCLNPESMSPAYHSLYIGAVDFIAFSVPSCIRIMTFYIWGIGIIGTLMLIPIIKYNNNQEVITYRIQTKKSFENQCHSEHEAIRSTIFWKIGVIIILASLGNYFLTLNSFGIPSETIHDEQFLSMVLLFGVIVNGFFRFIWGAFFNQTGFKWTFLVAMILNIFCFSVMPIAVHYYQFYALVYCIGGLVGGGLMVIMTNLSFLVFGDVGNEMFSYMWGAFTIANFIQYLISTIFYKIIPDPYLVLLFSITSLIALIFSSITKFSGKWENSLQNLQYRYCI